MARSLIHDQTRALAAAGVPAAALTSATPKEEVTPLLNQLARGGGGAGDQASFSLLYVTPERAVTPRFLSKLQAAHKAGGLARIVVDEAHCASAWGNDFRPDYKKLGVLKQQFADVPILAATATATARVQSDVCDMLRLVEPEVFRAPVDRPNLFFEVLPKPADAGGVADAVGAWVRDRAVEFGTGAAGLIYCLTRKDCEALAASLRERGHACAPYHADLDGGTRAAAHDAWRQGMAGWEVRRVGGGSPPHARRPRDHPSEPIPP